MGELANRIKAKYPQYANVPDAELEQKIVAKYPQYQTLAVPKQKTMGEFLGNVASSGARAVGDTVGAVANVFNPNMEQNTVANLLKLGQSVLEVAMPGEQGNEDIARQVGQYYAQRYGGLDKAWNSFYADPVGVAMDVSTVLTGAGGLLKGAGTASNVSGLTRAGKSLTSAGRYADPIALSGSKMASGTGNLTRKFANSVENASDGIITRGIGNPAAQAKLAQKSGRSVGSFIKEYDLYDRSPETAGQVKKAIISQYDDLALNSGNQLPMGQVIQQIDNEIAKLSGGSAKFSDAAQSQVAELMRRRQQLIEASGGTAEYSPVNVGVRDLTNFRRQAIDPDVPQSMYNLDARGSGTAKGAKATRDILRKNINSSDPRLEKLGMDYGMAKGFEKVLDQSASRANNRQVFNFTKLGSAGVGSVVAGAPGVVAGFALEQAVNHPRFIKAASKTLDATGKALKSKQLSNIGNKTANSIGKIYQAGKAARFISPDQKTPKSTNKLSTLPQKKEVESYKDSIRPSSTNTKIPAYKMPKKSNIFKSLQVRY